MKSTAPVLCCPILCCIWWWWGICIWIINLFQSALGGRVWWSASTQPQAPGALHLTVLWYSHFWYVGYYTNALKAVVSIRRHILIALDPVLCKCISASFTVYALFFYTSPLNLLKIMLQFVKYGTEWRCCYRMTISRCGECRFLSVPPLDNHLSPFRSLRDGMPMQFWISVDSLLALRS